MDGLVVRAGPRPLTTSATPHSQVNQQPPDGAHLAALLEKARGWPGVEEAPSSISVPGAQALVIIRGLPTGPPEAFLIDREFCHGHAQGDYSLHLTLPAALALEAEQAGWVEPHYLVLTGRLPRTVVMLYAPRDAGEVTIALQLVWASFTFARGASTPTSSGPPGPESSSERSPIVPPDQRMTHDFKEPHDQVRNWLSPDRR